jgi:hypothetical protein
MEKFNGTTPVEKLGKNPDGSYISIYTSDNYPCNCGGCGCGGNDDATFGVSSGLNAVERYR